MAVLAMGALMLGFFMQGRRVRIAPARISCVGDSITFGFGLGNREEECWVSLLPALLADGCETGNYGLSGSCVLSDGSLPWLESPRAREFWAMEEDLVIVMLGTNDVADAAWDVERFESEYGELVERVQHKAGNPRVIVMLPPRIFASPALDETLVGEAIPAIRRVQERAGADLVDLYTLTMDHPEWFDDGLHPNAEGNEAIAACIADTIRSA
ncbi:hypothetical protein EII22_06060 [Coriobacteriales bacterium OH1046]|nr:hypothetical protein EII22_06060 [Coriobacteriales bacterium OH1046]